MSISRSLVRRVRRAWGQPVETVRRPGSKPKIRWSDDDTLHAIGQSRPEHRGGCSPEQGARGRGAPPELEGRAPRVLRRGAHRETKELVAGFWIIQVKSKAEAIEWASRVSFADDKAIEVRQLFEASDFPPEILPPEAAAH